MEVIIFYAFASVTLIMAVLVISVRNPVHSAICLIATLISVAAIFLSLGAEFLTAVQILVYVGGIMVLFLFVVMLVSVERLQRMPRFTKNWKTAVVLGIVLAAELSIFYWKGVADFQSTGTPIPAELVGNTEQVGWSLYLQYMLPFEIASILLLVAIIGAVVYTRKREAD